MIRISKLSDYGIVLLSLFAADPGRPIWKAKDLAVLAGMQAPTVSKILKILSRAGLLVSHRGANGGYGLARPADQITIGEVVRAIEGPVALTDCSSGQVCALEHGCPVRSNWATIHGAVTGALDNLKLSDMTPPRPDLRPAASRPETLHETRKSP